MHKLYAIIIWAHIAQQLVYSEIFLFYQSLFGFDYKTVRILFQE